tara:strand:+ start:664 stop:1230 length:567 start_codon:yes stop_codon:yes gene_type:complete
VKIGDEMDQTYNNVKKVAYQKDTNCCTVISASIAFDKDYQETYDFFRANGRLDNRGLSPYRTDKMFRKFAKLHNYTVESYVPRYSSRKWNWINLQGSHFNSEKSYKCIAITKTKTAITINNFNDYLPLGTYILGVSGHVLAVKNGIIHDWSSNVYGKTSQRRVNRIYKIESNKKQENKKESDFLKYVY